MAAATLALGCSGVNALTRPRQADADHEDMQPWQPRTLRPHEAEEIAAELTEEDLERGRLEVVCGKWVIDDARTLSEAAAELRDFADWLVELELDGWQLIEPVDGGHAYLVNRDPHRRISQPEISESA